MNLGFIAAYGFSVGPTSMVMSLDTRARHQAPSSPRSECLMQLIAAQLAALLQLTQLWTVLGRLAQPESSSYPGENIAPDDNQGALPKFYVGYRDMRECKQQENPQAFIVTQVVNIGLVNIGLDVFHPPGSVCNFARAEVTRCLHTWKPCNSLALKCKTSWLCNAFTTLGIWDQRCFKLNSLQLYHLQGWSHRAICVRTGHTIGSLAVADTLQLPGSFLSRIGQLCGSCSFALQSVISKP